MASSVGLFLASYGLDDLPTTSARRQQVVVAVVEDASHVDDIAKEEVQKIGRLAVEIKGLIAGTRLSPLIACSLDTDDQGLISAFVERWHKETNNFHLPIGEVTITLDDVAFLLHLPIIGAFHNFDTLHVDEAALMLMELVEVIGDEARVEIVQCHGAYCCIYEHFPSTVEAFIDLDYDERSPRACCWTSTKASTKSLPASTPKRVVQQFGYVQTITPHSPGSRLSFEDIDDRWMHFFEYLALVGKICVVLGQCALDCIHWFYVISHPFMTLKQPGDLPRHPLVVQDETYVEPNMPEFPVVAAVMEEAPAHAPFDVEQPRHAVEACQAITERLEWLLNLRIVTEGTKAHDVMQDWLRITRGVNVECNVYVRSR
ncbi:Protein MAIN-LIKE 1 [Glycine max]|nr:Protein MAIN-LIKE 1 [Glycine max]